MSAFADAELVRFANAEFVAVAADDWYQRRRQDAEGAFWRKVADQGPRKGAGGSTRQGVYAFTADGQFLMHRHGDQSPQLIREGLKKALAAFQQLPESRRKPGAANIGDPGKPDPRFARTPPAGGLIATVYTRILDRDKDGFCKGTCETLGGDQAARDHLWLTADEVKALAPAAAKTGDRYPVPAGVVRRIARFHLLDNTRGEPPMWDDADVRSAEMTLTVESADSATLSLRLDGEVRLAKDEANGYDPRLLGRLTFDRAKGRFVRFDVVAVGDHRGEGPFTRGARPGKQPLGVLFELATGEKPADRVPPQAARDLHGYLGR